jgi:CheY-like chemotaxis protein
LGLAISKRILQLYNSELTVQSEPGQGSTFSFCLSAMIASAAPEKDHSLSTNEMDLHQAHILLVEDTEFNILLATQLLEGWHARISVAMNGEEAVAFLREHTPDLVLMDLQMPVMDGYSAARIIRGFNQQVPILALTASASEDVKEKVLAAGMQGHISKPFNPDELYQRLKRYL